MVNPDGITQEVHVDDAANAISQGYQVESSDERAVRDYQNQQGGSIVEGAKSFGEHALSSASFGISDWALSQDDEYRKNRQLRDATFAAPRILGEAAGFIVPGLAEAKALGTVGKVARVAAAPVRTVSKIASTAGRAAEHAIAGTAPGFARAMAAKVGGGLVSGALEGGAIGAGAALSEASIEDKPLTAELLLAHVRDGAVIGGTMGGGVGAVSKLLSSTVGLAKTGARYLPGIGEVLEHGPGGLAEMKALTSVGALGGDIKRIVKDGGLNAPHELGRRIINELDFAGPGAVGRAVTHDLEAASEAAQGRVAHYSDKLDDVYRRLDESGQRVQVGDVVGHVENEVLSKLRTSNYGGDRKIAAAIDNELAPLNEQIRKSEGVRQARDLVAEWKANVSAYHDKMNGGTPVAKDMLKALQTDASAILQHMESAGMGDAARTLRGLSSSLEEVHGYLSSAGVTGDRLAAARRVFKKGINKLDGRVEKAIQEHGDPSMSYREIWDLRQRVDKDVTTWEAKQDPRADAYRGFRNALRDQIVAQAERTGLAKEFVEANRGFHDWRAIEKIATQRAGYQAGNRTIGLTDTIAGTGGAALGGGFGGPLGSAAGVLIGTAGNKLLRSAAGDRLVATVANSFDNWQSVKNATSKAADELGARNHRIVAAAPVKQRVAAFATRMASEYDRQRSEVLEREADRDRVVAALVQQTGNLRDVAPELASAAIATGTRGVNYLKSILPEATPIGGLNDRVHPPEPSESAKAAWLRVAKVVGRPKELHAEVQKNALTPSQVEGVANVYPRLYDAIRTQVITDAADAADRGRMPDYQRRLQLSILTGTPLDGSMSPEVIAAYQAHFAAKKQAKQPEVMPRSPGRANSFASRRGNFTDREV
jgi:hypothetical protein